MQSKKVSIHNRKTRNCLLSSDTKLSVTNLKNETHKHQIKDRYRVLRMGMLTPK